jgi:hypothetical protein
LRLDVGLGTAGSLLPEDEDADSFVEFFNNDIDDIDEGITWADPTIRTDYEAALGRFILAFNEADYRLSQVIKAELSERGDPNLGETAAKGGFAERLEKLEILMSSAKNSQLLTIPIAQLKSLNGDRNNLAHGHFDQNPYDGSYKLILRAKVRDYPLSRILALTQKLTQIIEVLNATEIQYAFDFLNRQNVTKTQG